MTEIEKTKQNILNKALKEVPFSGFSGDLLEILANKDQIDPNSYYIYFPNGTSDLVRYYIDSQAKEFESDLKGLDFKNKKIREKIADSIFLKLGQYKGKELVVRAIFDYFASPIRMGMGLKYIWKTADLIWYYAGDTSTDYNYYSKRSLFSALYICVLLYWLEDTSKGKADTADFTHRGIESIIKFGNIKKIIKDVPSPLLKIPFIRLFFVKEFL